MKQDRNSAKGQNKSLLISSLRMASATFSSRILGLVREQVMAASFGATGMTDAFTIAYRIPNMLRDLFAEGAFSSAFVPIFTEAKILNEEDAKRLLWSLFILLTIITGIISVIIIIFAGPLIQFITNDQFTSDPERLILTTQLVRVMAPFLTFISLAALFMGVLNSLRLFFIPSLAPAFFNVVMIISMLALPPIVEQKGFHPIFSMGIGVCFGGLIQLLIQLPLIIKRGYGPIGPIQLISSSTKKILNRLGIGTIGIAANQINILITTVLATGTTLGAVSWLTYAFRLFQFPVGILSVSIAGSNLVHFSDLWKKGQKKEACSLLQTSYLASWMVILPAFVLLFFLAEETVHLVFQRGAFTLQDTAESTKALKAYLIGLPFYGLYKVFSPTFFILDKPKLPVFISVTSIIANIIFCVLLVPRYGFPVLALGTSLSMLFNACFQIFFLRRELSLSWSFFFHPSLPKFLLSALICALVTHYLGLSFINLNQGFFHKAVSYFFVTLLAGLSYLISLALLGETKRLKGLLKK